MWIEDTGYTSQKVAFSLQTKCIKSEYMKSCSLIFMFTIRCSRPIKNVFFSFCSHKHYSNIFFSTVLHIFNNFIFALCALIWLLFSCDCLDGMKKYYWFLFWCCGTNIKDFLLQATPATSYQIFLFC